MPIFDQGYHHWHGQRGGLGMRCWAIARQGVRVELRGRLTRLICLLGFVPSLLFTVVLALWGLAEQRSGPLGWFLAIFPKAIQADPKAYRTVVWTIGYQFLFSGQLLYCMVLIVLVGPRLISQDLRFNAIPLYFSRPLRRIDYFVGKWGVIATFIGIVAVGPALFAWVCGVAFSLDPTTLRDTWRIALGAVGYGLVITVSAGTLMLAFSSLSRRTGYVVILWFGFWLLTSTIAGVLVSLAAEARLGAEQRMAQGRGGVAGPEARSTSTSAVLDNSWYPLVSYTANLERIGNGLLDTRAAWQKVEDMVVETQRQAGMMAPPGPPGARQQYQPQRPDLVRLAGANYPWYWSAAVLAGLFGLSTAILRFRIRTLDRLK